MNASDPDKERSKLLQGLFDIADQDDSGSLDIDELRRIMPNADAFLAAVDTDTDGVISMAEFKAWSDGNIVHRLPVAHIARLNKLVQLARCGKSLNNGRRVEPREIFYALDVNGDSELALDEIKSVFGGDTLEIIGPLVDLLEQKHQALGEADFCEWCIRNHGDYHKLQSGALMVNKQVSLR
jgi:Ca2+-binding EF-hand superfamily protein